MDIGGPDGENEGQYNMSVLSSTMTNDGRGYDHKQLQGHWEEAVVICAKCIWGRQGMG
jgi:hypothetical protein